MANRRFHSVVVVDLTYAAVAVLVIAGAYVGGSVTLVTMFAAIAVGQVAALLLGVALMPIADRYLVPLRGDRVLRELIGFGGWRAMHLSVGPLKLWVIRLMVSGAAGFAAVGQLEANRLVMAPLMLAVQGAGSALLVSQAALVRRSPDLARRQADRDAATLALMVGVALLALLAGRVPISTLLLGSTDLIDPWLLAGWGVVAVGMALNVPYSNLTAVSGAPRLAFALRVWDLGLAVLGVAALMALLPAEDWLPLVPLLIGGTSCLLAVAQRQVAIRSTGHPAE
jgi:O-antigen/teichoic acid export membrane protein